jgi:hypothetical protein
MLILKIGVGLAVADSVIPSTVMRFDEVVRWTDWTGKVFPTIGGASALAQVLFFVGAVLLIHEPLRVRAWTFVILQAMAAISALIPALLLPTWAELIVRVGLTELGVLFLVHKREVKWSLMWQLFNPVFVVKAPFRTEDRTPICMIGAEILSYGYVLFGSNPLIGWILVFVGASYLVWYAYLEKKSGQALGAPWFRLNVTYFLGAATKISSLLVTA